MIVVKITSSRAGTGMMPQIMIGASGQKYAKASITPNTPPDAPMIGALEKIRDASAPAMPLRKYIQVNGRDPMRSSTRGPKKYSASMLNRMCMKPPCRNMYVTTVHGRTSTSCGTNANPSISPGWVTWTKNAAMLAMRSARTTGVTPRMSPLRRPSYQRGAAIPHLPISRCRGLPFGDSTRRLMKKLALFAAALAVAANVLDAQDLQRWERTAQNVTIIRDDWGIPHVYGKTDADAVFGMIYAQAEDDFNRVETNFITSLGRAAETEGEVAIYRDLRMKLFIDPDSM